MIALRAFLLLACAAPALALTPLDRVVPLRAGGSNGTLTLTWSTGGQPVATRIQRKPLLAEAWTTLAVLTNPAATSFDDTNVPPGAAFEYKVTRLDAVTNAWGFLYAGHELPPVTRRGTLVLAVESNTAAVLAPELARFRMDLLGDGWDTVQLTAPRRQWSDPGWAAAVTSLHAAIRAVYQADPDAVRAVLLFGRVPVPYSGSIAPDGHADHEGAWPADAYYGDMDGEWADLLASPTNGARLVNRPGDGKFDPSWFDSFNAELMVGRVDLSALPAFAQPELELLRQYLAKNHQVRHGRVPMPDRGLVRDTVFGYFPGSGEAFSQNGWRDFGTFYGPSNVAAAPFFPTLRTQPYPFAYGCGPGNPMGAVGVGTTMDFATGAVHAVFTMLFGSYFGDWDTTNNFLRAPLASTPSVLTCAWAGRPKWFSHPMDLGEPIGTVFRLLQGNAYTNYEEEWPLSGVHTALMGDPTLRLRHPAPPRNLKAEIGDDAWEVTWDPPDPGAAGYAVSRAEPGTLTFTNVTDGLTTGTSVTSPFAGATAAVFRVRAARREAVRSGSFTNLSQGVFIRVDAAGNANRPPAVMHVNIAAVAGRAVEFPLEGSDPDGDPVFTALVSWPAVGTLTGSPARPVYTPPAGFTGTVEFAYEASDGWADSPSGRVSIMVAPPATPRGTPGDWLVQAIGPTNDYGRAEEEDPDADGAPTWAEYRAGTDPLNPASVFAILSLEIQPGSNRLTWFGTTNSGVTSGFAVKKGTGWPVSAWGTAASNLSRHPSGTNAWVDSNALRRAFYRIVIP